MSGLNSDLVRDSKLEARFIGGATHHALLVSDPALGRRRRHEDERWFRKKRLGGGSYGTVWLESCTDGRKKGALRAVKEILKPSPSDSSKDFLDYGRELEAIAKFSNDKYADYFVKSYGWFDSDHAVYIAMEYIENGDLQKYLVDPFPEFEAQVIVSQLADGLEFMHNNAYTHRDLKPAILTMSSTLPAITNATDEFKLEEASAVWSTAELTKLSLEDQLGKGTSTELTQVPTLIQPRKKPFAEIAQAPFPIEPRKESSTELTQGHILPQPKNKAPIAPKPLNLILRFGNDDTFKPSFITTIGLDFKIRTTEVDGKRVKLQLWDTASQGRYRTITSAYYRGAAGIFLVYDVTNEESFNGIRIWNEEVDRNTDDRHVKKMLIGNNSDLVESRAISHERGQALADELDIPFLEVSSKLHVNVEDALFSLTRAIIKNLVINQQSVQNNVQSNPGPKSNEQGRWKGLKWPWT
ncbi:hypothetical protein G7Z17_g4387 [Cylindrodendrum hubeiense]|uniref:Protein kinase domain-containing protein n=1 Tax=Cylindrodendrum hubeiense TaxID=595255 RepID=A0A9P5H8V4_9HYPO|nr:hypothetical protein G7Z17_g4387 [Cylindrodendrum hubeiense]